MNALHGGQENFARAQHHANFLELRVCQIEKDCPVNLFASENLGVHDRKPRAAFNNSSGRPCADVVYRGSLRNRGGTCGRIALQEEEQT